MSLFEKQHEKAPEKRANLDEIDVMMDKNASTKNLEKDNADISHRKRRNSAMHQDRLPDLDDLRENAGIVVIPALIIVLIIVILILDHDSTNSAKASGASAGVVLETDASGNQSRAVRQAWKAQMAVVPERMLLRPEALATHIR